MLRRSLRIGLTLGLIGGAVLVVTRLVGRRSAPATDDGPGDTAPWPRLQPDPGTRPTTATTSLQPDPEAPAPAAAPAPASSAGTPVVTKPAPIAPKAAPAKKAAKKATKKAAPRTTKAVATDAWVEPQGDGCPPSHPVKAKLASRIFHLPGMLNYDRTRPDRCYLDAATATADGFRPAKR